MMWVWFTGHFILQCNLHYNRFGSVLPEVADRLLVTVVCHAFVA